MIVTLTKEWLNDSYDNPILLCEKLQPYFKESVTAQEIYQFLNMNGMYRPNKEDESRLKAFVEKKPWKIVQDQEAKLKKDWKVPNIPIFIFPSDQTNRTIYKEFNGKSGIAFHDKLFLFLSEENTDSEIRAVFTHEFNHVYRLSKYKKQEGEYHLLDTMILEGLAEHSVRERLGEDYTAKWTHYYTKSQLERLWARYYKNHQDITKDHPHFQRLLYGFSPLPKMLGYSMGYELVGNYLTKNQKTTSQVMELPSENFIDEAL
ncbi:DUF2268 domain-containing protein [Litchfieldia alkalitelluris]|uniref:DUF2268 domain-containing protein n=1 Tax=Litchfieldia alkalitelluris TaxID=304268 RepID=UPI0009967758|nr:DUF2268 domain-containing protein [Litchfieldia alkalitelluris]